LDPVRAGQLNKTQTLIDLTVNGFARGQNGTVAILLDFTRFSLKKDLVRGGGD